jgi:phospholipid/cholesterol/gamma-HCH transport system substrate-binding protein
VITRRIQYQLIAFTIVTVLAFGYGAVRLLGLGNLLHPGYEVAVQVASPDGLYPRADVDLLGTRVGRITALRPGPGPATTVTMEIDHDVRIPWDVRAAVGSKSAIGEGFVQLTPLSAGGPALQDGDTIPLSRTVSPVKLEGLLSNLEALAGSIPLDDLDTVLRESETALDGLGPSFGEILAGSETLSRSTLRNIDDTTALLRDARTVLTTQADIGPKTRRWAHETAQFLDEVEDLNTDFATLYARTASTSAEVMKLVDDLRPLLPPVLDNLIVVTQVAADRLPQLRKALAIFPWILENQVNTTRPCDDYDATTGEPVASSCHYDKDGNPIYQLHLSQQLDKLSGIPYLPCNSGYEETRKFTPVGDPVGGSGPKQLPDEPPNLRAHCAASPTDQVSPNVRGAQNVTKPAFERPSWTPR